MNFAIIFGIVLLVAVFAVFVPATMRAASKMPPPPPPSPKTPLQTIASRHWARVLYYNNLISMEELQHFYDAHPQDTDVLDGD